MPILRLENLVLCETVLYEKYHYIIEERFCCKPENDSRSDIHDIMSEIKVNILNGYKTGMLLTGLWLFKI